MNDRVHDSIVEEAVTAERERCAKLCILRGDISRESAKRLREAGTYTTRAIWPPFKKMTFVAPKWEASAQNFEGVGAAFDMVAECIRKGYDPDKPYFEYHPDERVDLGVHHPGRDPEPGEII